MSGTFAALRVMLLASAAVAAPSEPPPHLHARHSIGSPRNGRLEGAVRLPSGPGYYVRSRATSWGTPTMVAHLQTVLTALHHAHPDVRLRVGDLSRRQGGKLPAHRAHQSGRDVDLGLVPPAGVDPRGRFERSGEHDGPPMDPGATLDLLRLLAATSTQPGGAQWVLLDYRVQEVLHAEGVARGMDPAELDALFQYPHGRQTHRGFARHYPGHRRHMHVRFGCALEDRKCRGRGGPPVMVGGG